MSPCMGPIHLTWRVAWNWHYRHNRDASPAILFKLVARERHGMLSPELQTFYHAYCIIYLQRLLQPHCHITSAPVLLASLCIVD